MFTRNAKLSEFFCSPSPHRRLFAWLGLLILFTAALASALIQAWLNTWYGQFYNLAQSAAATAIAANATANLTHSSAAIAAHELGLSQLWALLWQFFYVAMPAALVSPLISFVTSHYALTWRLCLVDSYLERWERTDPNEQSIEGASQRIHEDTQRFASGLQSGVAVGVTALFQIAVFAPRLVQLGAQVPPPAYLAPLLGATDAWLLDVAITVAVCGFGVAWFVTRHLVLLEVANQRVEARLRKQLVLAEAPGTTLTKPAPSARALRRYEDLLAELRDNYSRLFCNFFGFNLWVGSWSQAVVLIPFALAGPRLFELSHPIQMGLLVQVADAFTQTFSSLAVGMDRWASVNDFRSVVRRLSEWEEHLSCLEELYADESRLGHAAWPAESRRDSSLL